MEGRHEDDAETAGQLEEIFKACTVIVKPSNKHLNHDNFEVNCVKKKVYQPAGEEEEAAIGFRQSENSTIEENAKEVLILVDNYYRETVY